MRTRLIAPVLGLALLVLSACTGGDDQPDVGQLEERLASAQAMLDDAERLDFSLTTKGRLPAGVSGLESAEGFGNRTPAFQGDITVSAGGAAIDAELVSVDGTVYAKLGFSPSFFAIDPAQYGAPDPAQLIGTPGEGLLSILSATDVTDSEQSRDGRDVLTTIRGTVPGDVIANLLPSADPDGEFVVTYRLDDDDVLRDATITGPIYEGADDVTYVVTATPSDEPTDITAP